MRLKKSIIIMLICGLTFTTFLPTISAKDHSKDDAENEAATTQLASGKYESKDEVIYGKLDANGKVKHMYVVNSFFLSQPGEIIDHGTYSNVRNLTDLTDIDMVEQDQIHFQADEEFYYQGELDHQTLPWHIAITYMLDGKEINPEQLAGKSGALEIRIETSENKEVDPVFFDYYLLQISVTMDPLVFRDIQAPKGTEANEGKNKLISFNGMPGTEDVMIISAHVENLKMDPIQIAAVPANIAFDDPDTDDLTDGINELADAIHEINSGVGELKNGVTGLKNGATELSKGSASYQKGINELGGSSHELVGGSKDILAALNQITQALDDSPDMPDLGDLATLPDGLRDMANQIGAFSNTLEDLMKAINQIPDSTLTDEEIMAIYHVLQENEADESVIQAVAQLETSYRIAQALKQASHQFPDQFDQIIKSLAGNIEMLANGIEEALGNLDQLDDLVELQNGLSMLAKEYQTFHSGLISYTEGVTTLATSYQGINEGTKGLVSGTQALEGGVSELKDGTQQLKEATDDLPEQIKTEIEKFMEEFDYSDFKPTSFVSSKNKNVHVVQFVLQTESIKLAEPEKVEEAEEVKQGLWDRFLDLFR